MNINNYVTTITTTIIYTRSRTIQDAPAGVPGGHVGPVHRLHFSDHGHAVITGREVAGLIGDHFSIP